VRDFRVPIRIEATMTVRAFTVRHAHALAREACKGVDVEFSSPTEIQTTKVRPAGVNRVRAKGVKVDERV
jgi:hypothetical protein